MNLIKPAFNNFYRTKKIALYIFSIAITLGLVIFFIYYLVFLNNVYAERIQNNIINRVILASKSEINNKDIEQIKNMKNIIDVYKRFSIHNIILDENIDISIKYCNILEIPNLTMGNLFDNDEFQIILPKKVFDRNDSLISLEEYYGKVVKLTIDNFEVEAEVIGIYDDIYFNDVYVNQLLKNEITNCNINIQNDNIISIVIDDYKNVDSTIETLKKEYNYSAYIENTRGQSDIKMYDIVSILIIIILILAAIFTYISIGIIISGIISDERKDLAIMKSLGYKNKDISKIMIYRVLSILIVSFFVGMILSFIFNSTFGKIIQNKLEIKINIDVSMYCIIALVLLITIYFISIIAVRLNGKKIKMISPIELLKNY